MVLGSGTVYYSSPTITVTSTYVDTAAGHYPVSQLDKVVRIAFDSHHALTVALFTGAVELAVALPFAIAYGSAAMTCVGLFVAFSVAVGALVDMHHNPRWMSLRAIYRGCDVKLFSTDDHREFGQVSRALLRAIEINRDRQL